MEPISSKKVNSSDEYLYQVKWDGIRMLAYLNRGRVELYNRKQRRRTPLYPELTEVVTGLACTSAVLDGEVIVLLNGRPDFFQVLKRELLSNPKKVQSMIRKIPVHYIIFDLLSLDGHWLTEQPLTQRLETLAQLVPAGSPPLHLCDSFDDGMGLWEATRQQGLEGIVAKERAGRYHPGEKHPAWQKVKHFRNLTATAVGALYRGQTVSSLLLGIPEEEGWVYIGRAGSGLNTEERKLLTEAVPSLRRKESPVIHPPSIPQGVVWMEPILRVEVRYMEWTPQGTLRSPTVIGFRLPNA